MLRNKNNNPEEVGRFNTKCVCQICTCGKHHCPRNQATRFEGESTHHHDYKPYNIGIDKRDQCKHQYQERHYDLDLIKSTYHTNFKPYTIIPDDNRKKYQYSPSKARFDDRTQYKTSYIGKQLARSQNINCNVSHYHPKKTRFQGTTTYNAEFTPKKGESDHYTPQNYQRKKVPFEGKTTYNIQFVPKEVQAQLNPQNHCKSAYQPRTGRFQGQTSYKQDYRYHKIQQKEQCPILMLPNYPRQCSPGKTHVNYSAEKHCWD